MNYARPVKSFSLMVVSTAGVLLFLPSYAVARDRPAPPDQLFEQQVADLKTSMIKARQGNSDIEADNEDLRNEIKMLEEEVQAAKNVQETVSEKPARELDYDALEAKETALYEQRLANLLRRQARLKELNDRKVQRLEYFEKDNSKAREDITRLQGELQRSSASLSDDKKNKSKKDKVSSKAQPNPADANKLQAVQKNLKVLGKDVAQEKAVVAKISAQHDEVYKENASLQDELTSGQNELKRMKSKAKLLDREVNAATSTSPLTAEQMADEVAGLENYAEELRQNLGKLKKVSSDVKADAVKDERQLLAHRDSLKEQQALLKEHVKIVSPEAMAPAEYDDLVAQKKDLAKQHATLLKQIEVEEQKSQKAPAQKSVSKKPNYEKELAQSRMRVSDLQEKIDALQKNPAGGKASASEALTKQLTDLETKLANLRDENKKPAATPQTPEEVARTKEAIKQLEAQRAILQSSLKTINSKYRLDDLTVKRLGTPEGELNEYLDALKRENSALQEKLLILQMQQDK